MIFHKCPQRKLEEKKVKKNEECTLDGSVDRKGEPAVRERTGSWFAAILILGMFSLKRTKNFGVPVFMYVVNDMFQAIN